ncbi:PhoH family protein [Lacibacterium aquatile]|uniref:PhoH-like protein n=1 Tax=Lacibacterium aquatile TaxID=1168082 RepID=A0ABW5DSE8_9PROT
MTETTVKTQVEPLYVTFEDNALLPLLFGEHDRNLARIEQLLEIAIVPRGNMVAISGALGPAQIAKDALMALYGRAKRGRTIDMGEVDAAVRMAEAPPAEGSGGGGEGEILRTRRKTIEPRSPTQRTYFQALRDYELVFGIGPAGTGKTYLAVAKAVSLLLEGRVTRLILSRPAVEAGERLGFLPGDMKDKVDPYLRPLYDALYDMMPADQVEKRLESGEIEVAPLAFMRGRTLANSFIILDEAQNTTPTQMKMFLTRMGEGSRMAITGDLSQIDLPLGARSGLKDAIEVLEGVKEISFVRFNEQDIVRHPMVTRIVKAYNAKDEQRLAMPGRPEERGG